LDPGGILEDLIEAVVGMDTGVKDDLITEPFTVTFVPPLPHALARLVTPHPEVLVSVTLESIHPGAEDVEVAVGVAS
jgi:hypothetical protein